MTIYTIIYNDYDSLKEPIFVSRNVNYIVFSETKKESKIWKWEKYPLKSIKDQRKLKILGHEMLGGDTIYIDASILICGNMAYFTDELNDLNDLTLLQHRRRNCIYDEYEVCKARGLDDIDKMKNQVNRYIDEGYPDQNGMVATGLLVRKGKKLNKVYRDWWKEVKNGSIRDQLSFNYIAWKHNINYDILSWTEFNRHFKLFAHQAIRTI